MGNLQEKLTVQYETQRPFVIHWEINIKTDMKNLVYDAV
jgi:hypothetical protein